MTKNAEQVNEIVVKLGILKIDGHIDARRGNTYKCIVPLWKALIVQCILAVLRRVMLFYWVSTLWFWQQIWRQMGKFIDGEQMVFGKPGKANFGCVPRSICLFVEFSPACVLLFWWHKNIAANFISKNHWYKIKFIFIYLYLCCYHMLNFRHPNSMSDVNQTKLFLRMQITKTKSRRKNIFWRKHSQIQ